MPGGDERAGLGLVVERPAEPDLLRPGDHLVDEVVLDRVLHDEPGASRADLAGVQEHGGQRVVEGHLDIGVGEDDVGVLAAELEGDLLDGLGGVRHQSATGLDASRERHEVDVGVRRQRAPAVGPAPSTRLPDAGRQPGLGQ